MPGIQVAGGPTSELLGGLLPRQLETQVFANMSRLLAADVQGMTSGSMHEGAFYIPSGTWSTLNHIWGPTASVGPTHTWIALYDNGATRNLLRMSIDTLTVAPSNFGQSNRAFDSVPVTAAALVGGTTYRYTYLGVPDVANGDSIVVSNCGIAGYNGTYTVTNLNTGTKTIDLNIGTNPAAFTTNGSFQMAAGKRSVTFTDGIYRFGVMCVAGTPNNLVGRVEGSGVCVFDSRAPSASDVFLGERQGGGALTTNPIATYSPGAPSGSPFMPFFWLT